MPDDTGRHLVALVVFAELAGVDEEEALYAVRVAVRERLREVPLTATTVDKSSEQPVHVIRVDTLDDAMGRGFIGHHLSPGRIRRGF